MLHSSPGHNDGRRCRAERMANSGHYYAAAVTTYVTDEARLAAQAARRQQLEDEQELQQQAFSRAKQMMQTQMSESAAERSASVADSNAAAMEAIRVAHDNLFALYAKRESTIMDRQPIQQAPGTLHLQRAEKRMALQKRYVEAAILQQLAHSSQSSAEDVVREQRQRQLCQQVTRYAGALDEKERILEEGLHAKQRLAEQKGTRDVACGKARLAHLESELLTTQARQRRQLHTLGFVPTTSATQSAKAHRGTQLERIVLSNTQTTPSLCEAYGHLLEQ